MKILCQSIFHIQWMIRKRVYSFESNDSINAMIQSQTGLIWVHANSLVTRNGIGKYEKRNMHNLN